MTVVDWMIVAFGERRKPIAYYDGEQWVKDPELAKCYYSEAEAASAAVNLEGPSEVRRIGLVKYESESE